MGTSAMTNSLSIGSRELKPGRLGLPAAAGLRPRLRVPLHGWANALRSDWLIAMLIFGVAVTLADGWTGLPAELRPSAQAAGGVGWIRMGASLALTAATVLSAVVMLVQRRALLAARQSLAPPSDTALGAESCHAAALHPDRECRTPEPAFDAAALAAECCEAAVVASADVEWQPDGSEPGCVAAPEAGQAFDHAAAATAPSPHAERMQVLGQLAAGIAHDFNNLLAAVQGSAYLIGDHADDPDAMRRHAGMILDATARGQSITRRLLSFSRREDSRPEPVDPSAVLHAVQQIASHTLGSRIAVRVEATCPLPRLLADRRQLETALLNLAVNARDAMPEGGTLTFAAGLDVVPDGAAHPGLRHSGTYIRISVSDTGAGIDCALLARVLEPFFTTKPPGQGTGLGLPMAKAFAEQSGGGLVVDSSPGRGTTVSLWLPVAAADKSHATAAAGAPKRILLAEDDPMVSETLAAVLEDAGYTVALARTVAEALAVLRSPARVDALVTDLSIRDLGGLALIEEAHRCRSALPAILLTACPDLDAALALKGAFSGAFSLLRKPVSSIHLVARIEALIAAVVA